MTDMKHKNIIILIPVYNDYKVLNLLLKNIKSTVRKPLFNKLEFIIINDGSDSEFSTDQLYINNKIEIIHLTKNMGHQKAIAIGLSYISVNKNVESLIIMDADGEDKPEYINDLIESHEQIPDKIIFSQRSKRKENLLYRISYIAYKTIFRILTGKWISFGNFCIIPSKFLHRVVMQTEIWHHFSGGIIKSKIPYQYIRTEKGKRLHGKSKMNFQSLVYLGLCAIATHKEFILVRILIFCSSIIVMAVIGFIIMLFGKYTFYSVIPAWTINMVCALLLVLVQIMLISLFSFFTILNNKNAKDIIPVKFFKDYILQIENKKQFLSSPMTANYFANEINQ
jgi:hypothetical protein